MNKVIDQIRKLLELAKSDNEHEAAAAAAAAQRLMSKHQIAEAELGGVDDSERASVDARPLGGARTRSSGRKYSARGSRC
jgi:hypothetical protein